MSDDPIYAVGDIHGQISMLETALNWIEADGGASARIIFLGDLVDRGPDSRAVVELISSNIAAGKPWRAVLGNHDRHLVRFLTDGTVTDARLPHGMTWLNPRMGGPETLLSYGVEDAASRDLPDLVTEARSAVPRSHLEWLSERPLYIETPTRLFVHAGIRPGIPLDQQDPDDLVWIREPFLIEAEPHPWLVVHGHTVVDAPQHCGNRVNLDSGAGYGDPLTAAVFEGDQVWTLSHFGRVPLERYPG